MAQFQGIGLTGWLCFQATHNMWNNEGFMVRWKTLIPTRLPMASIGPQAQQNPMGWLGLCLPFGISFNWSPALSWASSVRVLHSSPSVFDINVERVNKQDTVLARKLIRRIIGIWRHLFTGEAEVMGAPKRGIMGSQGPVSGP